MKINKHKLTKIVIVGRPNVGKSTLFNRILGRRRAIVQESLSTTRDRISCIVEYNNTFFELIDTGGIDFDNKKTFSSLVKKQVMIGVEEADDIIFVCDARTGPTSLDYRICDMLRKTGKRLFLAINKIDNEAVRQKALDFYDLGIGDPIPVSGLHGVGIADLLDKVRCAGTRPLSKHYVNHDLLIKLAVVGRPNSGKSSFVNSLSGNERVIVSNESGTTRDSVDIYLEKDGRCFIVIDTAGMRSKGKIRDDVTYFSILRTEDSIKRSDIVVVLLDGAIGLTKEDYRIIDIVQKAKKPFVVAVNKWDIARSHGFNMYEYKSAVKRDLKFIYDAPILFTSALKNKNVLEVIDEAMRLTESSRRNFSTSMLNELLKTIPVNKSKIYSIRQMKDSIPVFEIIAKNPRLIETSVKKFIVNTLRKRLKLEGVPVDVRYRVKTFRRKR